MSAAFSAKLEELKKELVADAVEDHVDLSWYVHDVRESFGLGEASDDTELMFHTAAFLYSLLEEGLTELADVVDECLRVDDPFVANRRVAARDVTVAGTTIAGWAARCRSMSA